MRSAALLVALLPPAMAVQGLPEEDIDKPAYWGAGWEDPLRKIILYKGLKVVVDGNVDYC